MTQHDTDYVANYEAMADEELLVLGSESGTLTGAAQAALQKELNRRQLKCNGGEQKGLVAARDRRKNGLPVRGWLLVLVAYMMWEAVYRFMALKRTNEIISLTFGHLSIATPPGVSTVLVARDIVFLLLSMLIIYAALGLLRKWRHSLKIAKVSLLAGVICSILFSVLVSVALSDTPIRAYVGVSVFTPMNVLSWALPNIGWLLYLRQSRRVRLTYRRG